MASQDENKIPRLSIAIAVLPENVDAGAEMTLRAQAACTPECDLRGHSLSVRDQTGTEMGRLVLTEFDRERFESAALVVTAPRMVGDYVWSAVSLPVEKDGVQFEETAKPFAFSVKPHTMRVLAWGAPPTVVAGEKFKMTVGIKCSSECPFANRSFDVYDDKGKAVANGTLNSDLWPGTTGLYFAEVEMDAPNAAGLHRWSAKISGSDGEMAHSEGAAEFGLRVVDPPECVVSVEAIARESQQPLAGAHITLHPYQAVSDARGIAEIKVAKGAYTLFVAQTGYLTLGLPVEVNADMTAQAELDLEPEYERN